MMGLHISAAAISGGMGDIKAAVVLSVVIVVNTAIGFYQVREEEEEGQ